jgi:proliferating cell nuclear antigen
MFKVIYRNAKEFLQFINGLSQISDKVILNLTEEGLIVRHLTEDKSIMAILNISKEVFDEYIIEKPISINIDLDSFKKLLKKVAVKKAIIELSETETGAKVVVREMSSGIKATAYIKGDKGSINLLNEPKVSLTVSFTVEGKILSNIVEEASVISEQIDFKAEEDKVEVSSEEAGKAYRAILRQEKPLKALRIDSPAIASYNLELIKDVVKAVRSIGDVTVDFGTNMPIKIAVRGEVGGLLGFWVAPRL